MDAAACIGCGACVAACPNSAAQLFTSAKLAHLNLLPQGQPERWARTEAMVETMEEYFGSCTNHGECEEACPKEISIDFIAFMNRDYVRSKLREPPAARPALTQVCGQPSASRSRALDDEFEQRATRDVRMGSSILTALRRLHRGPYGNWEG